MNAIRTIAKLTKDESDACLEYYRDASLLHAVTQGWIGLVDDSEKLKAFHENCATLVGHLDRALDKFELAEDLTVFSGHGRGFSILGALRGNPDQFRGLQYCYSGFTSTSIDRSAAENFLRTRSQGSPLPVLLEFRLRAGELVLPISEVTEQGSELELLLKRSQLFRIAEAQLIDIQDVSAKALHLVLTRD